MKLTRDFCAVLTGQETTIARENARQLDALQNGPKCTNCGIATMADGRGDYCELCTDLYSAIRNTPSLAHAHSERENQLRRIRRADD